MPIVNIVMTIKAFSETPLPRPVPMVPVAKPRGKMAMTATTPSSPHYANYVNYEQQSVGGAIPKKGGGLTSASEAESSGDSTSASMLNEAADAVAKYFAKLTQGINKGMNLNTYLSTTPLVLVSIWIFFYEQSQILAKT